MRVAQALKTGFDRAAKSWRGILVTWIIMLLITSALAVPVKAILKSGLGSSMITERFDSGINLETFTDMGQVFGSLKAAFGSGLLFLFLISFITGAFLNGGLFASVSSKDDDKSFWKSCAGNFWPFILIQAVTAILSLLAGTLITSIPALLTGIASGQSEKTMFIIASAASGAFILVVPVFLLVADYARASVVSAQGNGFFSAMGFGFRKTFKTFGSSWILMFLLVLIQSAFVILFFFVLTGMMPQSGNEVFLFFLLSQLLFIVRIFLRVLRYGSVTSLMEETSSERSSVEDFMQQGFNRPY